MKNKNIGSNWNDLRKEIFSSEEIAQSDERVQIVIAAMRKIRQEKKISQLEISRITGIKQPVISRIENGETKNPTIDTFIKILRPLGKTIAIVDLE